MLEVIHLPARWEESTAMVATLFDPLDGYGTTGVAVALLITAWLLRGTKYPLSVALAALASLAIGLSSNGLVDDGYITFRYAANLAAGVGPFFNPGEAIEGFSSGPWIALIAGGARMTGLEAGIVGRILSLAFAPLSTILAAVVIRRAAGRDAGAAASTLWAGLPTIALYSATGLETVPFAAALWALAASAFGSRTLGVVGAVGVASLRPEGGLLLISAVPFWRRLPGDTRRAIVWGVSTAAGLAGLRMALYGQPMPRSAMVKAVTASAGLTEGIAYLAHTALEVWPLTFGLVALLRYGRQLLPGLVPSCILAVLVVSRGGDWMPGARYLLPLVALMVAATATLTPRLRRVAVMLTISWSVLQLVPTPQPAAPLGRLWHSMSNHRAQSRWWEGLGRWLAEEAPGEWLLAAGPVGALPYASGLRTFDMYGLVSPVVTLREGGPGHRLWGGRQAAAAKPELLYTGHSLPQGATPFELVKTAQVHISDIPQAFTRYQPVVVLHRPEYRYDILGDVIWVRRDVVRDLKPPRSPSTNQSK